MPRTGENIYKRKDGRWEARIIVEYDPNGKAKYKYLYAKHIPKLKQNDPCPQFHRIVHNYNYQQRGQLRKLANKVASVKKDTSKAFNLHPIQKYHRVTYHSSTWEVSNQQDRDIYDGKFRVQQTYPR